MSVVAVSLPPITSGHLQATQGMAVPSATCAAIIFHLPCLSLATPPIDPVVEPPASHTGNGGPLSHLRLGAPSGTAQRKWAPAVSSYGLPWLALAPLLIPLSLAYTPAPHELSGAA